MCGCGCKCKTRVEIVPGDDPLAVTGDVDVGNPAALADAIALALSTGDALPTTVTDSVEVTGVAGGNVVVENPQVFVTPDFTILTGGQTYPASVGWKKVEAIIVAAAASPNDVVVTADSGAKSIVALPTSGQLNLKWDAGENGRRFSGGVLSIQAKGTAKVYIVATYE